MVEVPEKVVWHASKIGHVTPDLVDEVISLVVERVLQYFGSVVISDAGPALQQLLDTFVSHHSDGAIRFGLDRK